MQPSRGSCSDLESMTCLVSTVESSVVIVRSGQPLHDVRHAVRTGHSGGHAAHSCELRAGTRETERPRTAAPSSPSAAMLVTKKNRLAVYNYLFKGGRRAACARQGSSRFWVARMRTHWMPECLG